MVMRRSLVVAPLLFLLLATFATARQPAGAIALYKGSLQLRAHVCPTGALRLSEECTRPGPVGVTVAIDDSLPVAMDNQGEINFDDLVAGAHLVTLAASPYAERFQRMEAYCSHSPTGNYPTISTILPGQGSQYQVPIAARSQVTCELPLIP